MKPDARLTEGDQALCTQVSQVSLNIYHNKLVKMFSNETDLSVFQAASRLLSKMNGCSVMTWSSGQEVWEFSRPAEIDKSHLLPHRHT